MIRENVVESASTGVMSLKMMPFLGKFGTFRISFSGAQASQLTGKCRSNSLAGAFRMIRGVMTFPQAVVVNMEVRLCEKLTRALLA